MDRNKRRIVVAITGATGSIYGIRLLEALAGIDSLESHLIVSAAGYLTAASETDMSKQDIEALADVVYSDKDIGATVASGSFQSDAMVVAPCSMKTLAAVATGMCNTLIARSADVALKERRRLVLVTRETPLHLGHLKNMQSVTEMGGIVFPPVPAFYARPTSIDELVDHTVGRVLANCGIDNALFDEWQGLRSPQKS